MSQYIAFLIYVNRWNSLQMPNITKKLAKLGKNVNFRKPQRLSLVLFAGVFCCFGLILFWVIPTDNPLGKNT